MGVVEDEERSGPVQVLAEDRVRRTLLSMGEEGPEPRPADRGQEVAEACKEGPAGVPGTDPVPVQVPRPPEDFARLRREARLPDPRHAPDDDGPRAASIPCDGREFRAPSDERLHAGRLRQHLHESRPGGGDEGGEIDDPCLNGLAHDIEDGDLAGDHLEDLRDRGLPDPFRIPQADDVRFHGLPEPDRRHPPGLREAVHLPALAPPLHVGGPFADQLLLLQGSYVLREVADVHGRRARDGFLRHPPRDFHRLPVLRELEKMEEDPFLCGGSRGRRPPAGDPAMHGRKNVVGGAVRTGTP